MIELVVCPIGLRSGRFNSWFQAFVGERLVCEARRPLFTSARKLLDEGVSPGTPITLRNMGSKTIAIPTTVGEAAGVTVVENEREGPYFAPYRPGPTQMPLPDPGVASQAGVPNRWHVDQPETETAVLA